MLDENDRWKKLDIKLVNGETPVFVGNIGRAMARDLADRRAAT